MVASLQDSLQRPRHPGIHTLLHRTRIGLCTKSIAAVPSLLDTREGGVWGIWGDDTGAELRR